MSKPASNVYILRIIDAIPPSWTRKFSVALDGSDAHRSPAQCAIRHPTDLHPELPHWWVLDHHEDFLPPEVWEIALKVTYQGFEIHGEVRPSDFRGRPVVPNQVGHVDSIQSLNKCFWNITWAPYKTTDLHMHELYAYIRVQGKMCSFKGLHTSTSVNTDVRRFHSQTWNKRRENTWQL